MLVLKWHLNFTKQTLADNGVVNLVSKPFKVFYKNSYFTKKALK